MRLSSPIPRPPWPARARVSHSPGAAGVTELPTHQRRPINRAVEKPQRAPCPPPSESTRVARLPRAKAGAKLQVTCGCAPLLAPDADPFCASMVFGRNEIGRPVGGDSSPPVEQHHSGQIAPAYVASIGVDLG